MKTAGLMFTPTSFRASRTFTFTCAHVHIHGVTVTGKRRMASLAFPAGAHRCQINKGNELNGLTWKLRILGVAAATLADMGLKRLRTER